MNQTLSRSDRQIALALLLGFLMLYVATLCPTVYFGDSGEISAAIARNGVIHPPGYPLFGLLGRLALVLVPVGEAAFRIGCVTALSAALTIPTLFLLQRRLTIGQLAAAIAAAIFGVSFTFWSQSERVEVYSLHVLLCALALLFAVAYRDSRSSRHLRLTCLFLALGLAHHLTIVLLLPGLLILVGKRFWSEPGLGKRFAVALPPLLVTPALYALLPLFWARDSTLHNWGDPSHPVALFNHVSARIYRGYYGLHSLAQLQAAAAAALATVRESLPWYVWAGALVGGGLLWRRDRAAAAGLATVALTVAVNTLNYRILDISAYYLPVVLVASATLGVAFDLLVERLVRIGQGRLPLILAAAPAALALANFNACNLHDATLVREFALHKLESCDPNAVLLAQGDQDIHPLVYAQEILHARPDVLALGREYLNSIYGTSWDSSHWYLRILRAKGIDAPMISPKNQDEALMLAYDGYFMTLLEGALKNRPVHMTFLSLPKGKEVAQTGVPLDRLSRYLDARYIGVPQGLVIAFHPKSEPVTARSLAARGQERWDRVALPELSRLGLEQEMDPEYLAQHYVTMLSNQGYLWERAGEPQNAVSIYRTLLEWQPDRGRAMLRKHTLLAAEAVKRTQLAASR